MKQYWERFSSKVDAMAIRERGMMFAATAIVMIALIDTALLEPLLAKQKTTAETLKRQQKEMQDLQVVIDTVQKANLANSNSPLRARITQLQAQLQEKESFLQSRSDRLVEPDKIAELMEQMLHSDDKLQLLEMKTLPLSLLIEQPTGANKSTHVARPIYKHGVQITVRGGYMDLLRYLDGLEKLPAKMFWGEVSMSAEKYPEVELTLTVYTLSLDKTWLTV